MKQLIKVKNSDLSLRLNLNYNNVFSRLKMLLGSDASLFADLSTKASWTWFSDDDAEYTSLADAPKSETNAISVALSDVVTKLRKKIESDSELSKYVDDILEIPDNGFVFYRKTENGYKFILAGWGCRYAHQSATDTNSFIKRISKELPEEPIIEEPKKQSMTEILGSLGAASADLSSQKTDTPPVKEHVTRQESLSQTSDTTNTQGSGKTEKSKVEIKKQKTTVKVIDQNNATVRGEKVILRSSIGEEVNVTSDKGLVEVGELPYGELFSISFPNLQGNVERSFEVVPGVDTYEAYIKKLIKFSPVLFIEDQNGNTIQDYNIKVIVSGQESVYNSGNDGVVQLPPMQEGQKFIVIDTANYANTEEYNITQADAKTPYHFHIRRAEQTKVGITVLDKTGSPIPNASIHLSIGDTPCQATTAENGRAEFPSNLFIAGDIPATLSIKGQGTIKSNLRYTPDVSEYTIQLKNKKAGMGGFQWKWLSLIPLLLLFGWGGNELYKRLASPKIPTLAEMESGVVMTISQTSYFVDLNVKDIMYGNKPLKTFYFTYNPNERTIDDGTFDIDERVWGLSTGTGFLISKDGLIGTNRHVADPIAPEEVSKLLREYFQDKKDTCQKYINKYDDQLKIWAGIGKLDQDYLNVRERLQYYNNQKQIFDKILNTADFKAQVRCKVSVAFTGTRVDDLEELQTTGQKGLDLESFGFHKCSTLKSGNPGTVLENDVAIIQLNSKNNDIPENAFIFEVPEKDILENEIPDDYEITVLGYNAGMGLQDMKLQEGIHPQAQHGKISNTSEKYRIGYSAQIIGGSSGSPVLNQEHKLVAINNSGMSITQGFNYGVRIKYLKELLDDINKNDKNK